MSSQFIYALLFAAFAGTAQAQQFHEFLPDQGTKEIDFTGSLNLKPVDSLNLGARVGYFLNPRLQVGVDSAYARIENGTTERSWTLGAFGNWHFPGSSALLPYVGAFAGLSDTTGGDSSTSLGVQGGVKYFFNRNVAAFAEARWRDVEDSDDQTGIFVGISVFLK
jgi:hypothetical protein